LEDKEIVVSYDTLFELLRIERSRTEIQNLPKNFLDEVVGLLNQITNEKKQTADDDVKRKAEIHLKSTLKILKELYERRERKIVNMALDKSKTRSAIIDFSRFLDHEKDNFNQILEILDSHRKARNNDILIGQDALLGANADFQPESMLKRKDDERYVETEGEKSDEKSERKDDEGDEIDSFKTEEENQNDLQQEGFIEHRPVDLVRELEEGDTRNAAVKDEKQKDEEEKDSVSIVRFVSPFPSFLGKKLEIYGPYDEDEVVSLPAEIAELLVKKNRAEIIAEIKD
jgi:hypothetical protein